MSWALYIQQTNLKRNYGSEYSLSWALYIQQTNLERNDLSYNAKIEQYKLQKLAGLRHVNLCTKYLIQVSFLSRQTRVCRNKTVFSPDKSMLVVTNVLLRQTHVCCVKYLLQQKFCHNKNILSRQTILLQQVLS